MLGLKVMGRLKIDSNAVHHLPESGKTGAELGVESSNQSFFIELLVVQEITHQTASLSTVTPVSAAATQIIEGPIESRGKARNVLVDRVASTMNNTSHVKEGNKGATY